ncbi:MAG: hypothetical protein QXO40_03400 [Candidatus Aenigmatarchaeota archaeon]
MVRPRTYKYLYRVAVKEFLAKHQLRISSKAFEMLDRFIEYILLEIVTRTKARKKRKVSWVDIPLLLFEKTMPKEEQKEQTKGIQNQS